MLFTNTKPYVDPLLSNVALDYSVRMRQGLIAPVLFPRVPVEKPSGYYTKFSKEDVFRLPETRMQRNKGQANNVTLDGEKVAYATEAHGLKQTVDNARAAKAEGPFARAAQRVTEYLTGKLEQAQEARVASLVTGLAGATTGLTGTGTAATNVWAAGGGKPLSAIETAASKLVLQPNVVVIPRAVYNALKIHPDVVNRLPTTSVQRATAEAMAVLFDVERVVIADGLGYAGKKTEAGGGTVASIWGNVFVLARVSDAMSLDEPCAGKTLAVEYPEADASTYVVRVWEEPDHGLTGGMTYMVGHDVQELVIAPDLIHTLTGVLG